MFKVSCFSEINLYWNENKKKRKETNQKIDIAKRTMEEKRANKKDELENLIMK